MIGFLHGKIGRFDHFISWAYGIGVMGKKEKGQNVDGHKPLDEGNSSGKKH